MAETNPTALLQTPLYPWHVENGGRMVDFAGWSMPVQYASITAEHHATRAAAGLFDISHMGRLRFDGAGAAAFLDGVTTRCASALEPGDVRYALVTNEQGGVLDDVLIYRLGDEDEPAYYLMVVNASNRVKIVDWLKPRLAAAKDVAFRDMTRETAMIAVQGPESLKLAQDVADIELTDLKYYTAASTLLRGHEGLASRTGYTGEDGVELIVPSNYARRLWETLFEGGGEESGGVPAGLGARDTLRLEAGLPLYGHELNESINPFQAGLDFAVDLDGHDFVGAEALRSARGNAELPKRVGLEFGGKKVPREGCPILSGTQRVGEVTSGTYSPTLVKPIAMAYVHPKYAAVGTQLLVDIREKHEPARVVPLPFYRRKK